MKNLYVVAHAQSEHHVERRVGGWYDTGLTDLGRFQAKRISRSLRELLPEYATVELYSSDLKRAYETAEAISQLFGVPVETTSDLREKSYGEAEGKPQAWLDERLVHAPRSGDRLDHDEGIAGAETRRQFAERIYRAVDRILASPCEDQIVVTHGGALTFVVAAWIKMPVDAAGHIAVKSTSGGITHLQEDDIFRNRRIMSVNDTPHLLEDGAINVHGEKAIAAARADVAERLDSSDWLGATFSAAHILILTGKAVWSKDDHERMIFALEAESRRLFDEGKKVQAAWRAAYLVLLEGRVEADRAKQIADAVRPTQPVDWGDVVEVGRAADFFLLSGQAPWSREEIEVCIQTVRRDRDVHGASGNLVMVADRFALEEIIGGSVSRSSLSARITVRPSDQVTRSP